ncbi:hypothetical protein quinque_005410 [Culex quinquefasciatus]
MTYINECEHNNGGCEQICTNQQGSFECNCQYGLQIDVLDGRSCIDVNECLLRNGHGPCQDTCINLWASYNCSCQGLPGTRLAVDGHSCEDDAGECPKAGCSHQCLSTMGRPFCLCPVGLHLGDDWKTCEGNFLSLSLSLALSVSLGGGNSRHYALLLFCSN